MPPYLSPAVLGKSKQKLAIRVHNGYIGMQMRIDSVDAAHSSLLGKKELQIEVQVSHTKAKRQWEISVTSENLPENYSRAVRYAPEDVWKGPAYVLCNVVSNHLRYRLQLAHY